MSSRVKNRLMTTAQPGDEPVDGLHLGKWCRRKFGKGVNPSPQFVRDAAKYSLRMTLDRRIRSHLPPKHEGNEGTAGKVRRADIDLVEIHEVLTSLGCV